MCMMLKKYIGKEELKQFVKFVVVSFILGSLAYLILISNQYTNQYDGLWRGSDAWDGRWNIQTGRWMIYLCYIIRGKISYDPLCSYMAILIFSMGNYFVVDIFSKKTRGCFAMVMAFLLIVNVSVLNQLSYRYMSVDFALSYLFAVISVWTLIKMNACDNFWCPCVMSLAFATLSLAFYQANIGCMALIWAAYLWLLLKNRTVKRSIVIFTSRFLISSGFACILYYAIWKMFLLLFRLSPANYKGADSFSVIGVLKSFPQSFLNVYLYFGGYFNGYYHINLLQKAGLFQLLCFLLLAVGIFFSLHAKHIPIVDRIIMVVIIIMIPAISGCINFLTPNAGFMLQMSMSYAILIPIALCILYYSTDFKVRFGIIIVAIVLTYGNIASVTQDIDAIAQGTKASEHVMVLAISNLLEESEYDKEQKVVFVGTISDNVLFEKNSNWDNANKYAQFGDFWNNPECLRNSYCGLLKRIGICMNIANADEWNKIYNDVDVDSMPSFPENGSIIHYSDYVVIKMSDNYYR